MLPPCARSWRWDVLFAGGGAVAVSLVRILYLGGPTAVIEIGPWRLITDPTFDPPGRRYFFGWGTASRKLHGPAIAFSELGPARRRPPQP